MAIEIQRQRQPQRVPDPFPGALANLSRAIKAARRRKEREEELAEANTLQQIREQRARERHRVWQESQLREAEKRARELRFSRYEADYREQADEAVSEVLIGEAQGTIDHENALQALQDIPDLIRDQMQADLVPVEDAEAFAREVVSGWVTSDVTSAKQRLSGNTQLKFRQQQADRLTRLARERERFLAWRVDRDRKDRAEARKLADEAIERQDEAEKARVTKEFGAGFRERKTEWLSGDAPPPLSEQQGQIQTMIDELVGNSVLSQTERDKIADQLRKRTDPWFRMQIEDARKRQEQERLSDLAEGDVQRDEMITEMTWVIAQGLPGTEDAMNTVLSAQKEWSKIKVGGALIYPPARRREHAKQIAAERINHAYTRHQGRELRERWLKGQDPILAHELFSVLDRREVEELFDDARGRQIAQLQEDRRVLEDAKRLEDERQDREMNAMVAAVETGALTREEARTGARGKNVSEVKIEEGLRLLDKVKGSDTTWWNSKLAADPDALDLVADFTEQILTVDTDLNSVRREVNRALTERQISPDQRNEIMKLIAGQSKVRAERPVQNTQLLRDVRRYFTDHFIPSAAREQANPLAPVVVGFDNLGTLPRDVGPNLKRLVLSMEADLIRDGVFQEGSYEHVIADHIGQMAFEFAQTEEGFDHARMRRFKRAFENAVAAIGNVGLGQDVRPFFGRVRLFDRQQEVIRTTEKGELDDLGTMQAINRIGDPVQRALTHTRYASVKRMLSALGYVPPPKLGPVKVTTPAGRAQGQGGDPG